MTMMSAEQGDLPRLRFVILAERGPRPSWQAECVQKLTALPGLKLVATVTVDELRGAEGLSSQAEGLTSQSGSSAVLRSSGVDFILCLADAQCAREFVTIPRYGVWAFNFGDWEHYRGGPAGFWEVYDGVSTTSAMLVRLTEDADLVMVLRRACLRTKRVSARQNHAHILTRIDHWPAQVCVDIRNGVLESNSVGLRSSARARANPTALQKLVMRWRTLNFAIGGMLRQLLRHDQWNIGVVRQPIQDFLDPHRRAPIEWLPARPPQEMIADPFGVVRDGKLMILCEYLDYRHGLGTIAAVAPPDTLTPARIGPEPAVHMSFPFLIEQQQHLYCVPETYQAAEVALYELERFPDRWVKRATLLPDTALVDVTLTLYAGRWWLAGTDPGLSSPSADLFLWYSDTLEGPWQPHCGNPVKTDVRSARAAGTPFIVDGVLYRPTMDCSQTYGGRVHINRVHTLTPVAFGEEIVTTLEPDADGPYPDGLHTLSAVGDVTLVDGKRSIFIRAEFARMVGAWLHKLRLRHA